MGVDIDYWQYEKVPGSEGYIFAGLAPVWGMVFFVTGFGVEALLTPDAQQGGEQMKKVSYTKPQVLGSANVHPC